MLKFETIFISRLTPSTYLSADLFNRALALAASYPDIVKQESIQVQASEAPKRKVQDPEDTGKGVKKHKSTPSAPHESSQSSQGTC